MLLNIDFYVKTKHLALDVPCLQQETKLRATIRKGSGFCHFRAQTRRKNSSRNSSQPWAIRQFLVAASTSRKNPSGFLVAGICGSSGSLLYNDSLILSGKYMVPPVFCLMLIPSCVGLAPSTRLLSIEMTTMLKITVSKLTSGDQFVTLVMPWRSLNCLNHIPKTYSAPAESTGNDSFL